MAWNLPDSGEMVRLSEVIDEGRLNMAAGRVVRVMARLESYDCAKQQAVVSSPERNSRYRLLVDTRLIEPLEARQGSLVQLLGEMEWEGRGPGMLRARVARRADGVDVGAFDRALEAQRRFLARRRERRERRERANVIQSRVPARRSPGSSQDGRTR